jgi:DNA repair protein RadC
MILNTRRRIKGHYLVSVGTMDTILCHPREVFRLAIMASASAIVIAHIIPAALYRVPFYAAWLAICPIFTG